MSIEVKIHGISFSFPEFTPLENPETYVKTQLGIIVVRLRLDTIYDSLTGYPVGALHLSETRAMLDQIWHSELAPELAGLLERKAFPTAVDFLPVIESGVDQLRIRMLATIRPTPALAFQRDLLAMERIRKHDPNRIASYLLIRLLTDNNFQRANVGGLNDVLARHESAIAIGQIVKTCEDTVALAKMTRQLIELDARFDITRLKFSDGKRAKLAGFLHLLMNGTPADAVFAEIAIFANKQIGESEMAETIELGNRAMRPAYIEKTREEVIAGIHAEADRIQQERDGVAKKRTSDSKPKVKVGKIDLSRVDFSAILGIVTKVQS